MSKICEKIKYKTEGPYGSVDEKTLYCESNASIDVTTFFYDDGTRIFSFEDTLDNNIFDKMIEIIKNWKDNPNVETMTIEDCNKCGI